MRLLSFRLRNFPAGSLADDPTPAFRPALQSTGSLLFMHYYLDTEFNGFAGELISLALVPEYGDQEFYASLPLPDKVHTWVQNHVIPYLRHVPPGLDHQLTREQAAQHIALYLEGDPDAVIVADWPEDLAHFCALLVTAPGQMADINGLRFELINAAGFSAAANSRVPHNALHDARALRDFKAGI
jgi:hypothetical protein